MKKNVLPLLLLVIAPIAVGAVIMSYGADMVIDGIGLLIMLIGCGIGVARIIKRKLKDAKLPFWALFYLLSLVLLNTDGCNTLLYLI